MTTAGVVTTWRCAILRHVSRLVGTGCPWRFHGSWGERGEAMNPKVNRIVQNRFTRTPVRDAGNLRVYGNCAANSACGMFVSEMESVGQKKRDTGEKMAKYRRLKSHILSTDRCESSVFFNFFETYATTDRGKQSDTRRQKMR